MLSQIQAAGFDAQAMNFDDGSGLHSGGSSSGGASSGGGTTSGINGDGLTHASRVALLGRATALVTVGGSWLSYAAFLPSDERATALVEIYAPLGSVMPQSAKAAARFSIPRNPSDPFSLLSRALMGVGRYRRVAAWALPESNCTAGAQATRAMGQGVSAEAPAQARTTSCGQARRIVVDAEAVVRGVVMGWSAGWSR